MWGNENSIDTKMHRKIQKQINQKKVIVAELKPNLWSITSWDNSRTGGPFSSAFSLWQRNTICKNVIAPGETVQRTYTIGYRARDRRSLHVRHDEGRVRPEQRRLAGEWSVCVWVDG